MDCSFTKKLAIYKQEQKFNCLKSDNNNYTDLLLCFFSRENHSCACKEKENKLLKLQDLGDFHLKSIKLRYLKFMSGDNMLGEQPLKFYSKEMTDTKIELVNRLLILNAKKNSIIDLDRRKEVLIDRVAS